MTANNENSQNESPMGEAKGSIEAAITNANALLDVDPKLAEQQASEILGVVPGYPPAQLLIAVSLHHQGKSVAARDQLADLVGQQEQWAAAHFEYALVLAHLGEGDRALQELRRTVELKPMHSRAWRHLGDHLMAIGEPQQADQAYARHIQCSTKHPDLQRAADAMVKEDVALAERILKAHLKHSPTDVPAIRMLAEVAVRCAQTDAAENLLKRCLELAPSFNSARYNYAVLLHRRNESQQALEEVQSLLESEPRSPAYRNLHAVLLSRVGEYADSSAVYYELLGEYPENAKVWLSYGHVLKTEGRTEECVQAYRKAIERDPRFGEAYWSLANLKTFKFEPSDLEAMQTQLKDPQLDVTNSKSDQEDNTNRLHFHFALGKAFEDSNQFEQSFLHYQKGNQLHHQSINYEADKNTARAQRLKSNFNHSFFEQRADCGFAAADPIFIVGMPRSGSTLLEQILASHSQVEGTTELPDIISIAKSLREAGNADKEIDEDVSYDQQLASLTADQLAALGKKYIDDTRIHRKTDRPLFIDKMPNNFLHIGLIQLILPNAKIIDARRHPMACCFSNFKQYYARGQSFTYSLSDMGRFYHDYVDLMAHYDAVLPNRIHRVIYENTVGDTEATVRNVLNYCGLPFEEQCLRFFENKRPVRTASSEQVRQPIYTAGVDQWRNYEPWLQPLTKALGPVLTEYPQVPKFE